MPYGWKIEHNGSDISSKVAGFTIRDAMDCYCREMTLQIQDAAFYNALDFGQISETPEIEIFTRTGAEYVSQGKFFIERPDFTASVNAEGLRGVWGRSSIAALGEPFAPKITSDLEVDSSFFEICGVLCARCGLTWDPAYSGIDDFTIYAYTYSAGQMYPIEILSELAGFAGALIGTDAAGHLCIRQIDYAPTTETLTLTDAEIREISEAPEWPAFGNRIRISAAGSGVGYAVDLIAETQCLTDDGATQCKLYAVLTDADGNPVNGVPVNWSIQSVAAAISPETSNTQTILITDEIVNASNFYQVELAMQPSSLSGVYAYADYAKQNNLLTAGHTISGNQILLDTRLAYCDQKLRVDYEADGVATAIITAGTMPEDATVTASVEGESAALEIYIGNPCQCPPSITLSAAPESVLVNEETASILVYVEEGGPVTTGKKVYVREAQEVKGELRWDYARLGTVAVPSEKTSAINEISGITQCKLSMYAAFVSAVYRAGEDGNATGGNLYASHNGKSVTLSTILPTGTELAADYVAQGAVLNQFKGTVLGKTLINASMESYTEAPLEDHATITITDENGSTDDDDLTNGGVGGSSGLDIDDTTDDEWSPREVSTGSGESGSLSCVAQDVSSDADDSSRFSMLTGESCTCEVLCEDELARFGTTQSYDNGSYRTLLQIVTEDYGFEEGSPEYYEQYAVEKEAAKTQCINDCTECADVEDLELSAPETIDQSDSIIVSASGGKGPYSWSVSGAGFTMGAEETETGDNTVITDGTACGACSITVSDDCGNSASLSVRCTTGSWVAKPEEELHCGVTGDDCWWPTTDYQCLGYEISGDTKYYYDNRRICAVGAGNCGGCELLGGPTSCGDDLLDDSCGAYHNIVWTSERRTWKWEC